MPSVGAVCVGDTLLNKTGSLCFHGGSIPMRERGRKQQIGRMERCRRGREWSKERRVIGRKDVMGVAEGSIPTCLLIRNPSE